MLFLNLFCREQINAGAVMLTDCIYWFIIFPFLTIKDYNMSFVSSTCLSFAFYLNLLIYLLTWRYVWKHISMWEFWKTNHDMGSISWFCDTCLVEILLLGGSLVCFWPKHWHQHEVRHNTHSLVEILLLGGSLVCLFPLFLIGDVGDAMHSCMPQFYWHYCLLQRPRCCLDD